MPKRLNWVDLESFASGEEAEYYCIYGTRPVDPTAVGRPAIVKRKYTQFSSRDKGKKFYKCIEHSECKHKLSYSKQAEGSSRFVQVRGKGEHSLEIATVNVKRRHQKITKSVKEEIVKAIGNNIIKPGDIKNNLRLPYKNISIMTVKNFLRVKSQSSVGEIVRAARVERRGLHKQPFSRSKQQQIRRNIVDRRRRARLKEFRKELRAIQDGNVDYI